MISHAQRIRHNGQGRIHRAARHEETSVHYVKIVDVVRATVQTQHRRLWGLAELARANLMSKAVHRHLRFKVARLESSAGYGFPSPLNGERDQG